MAHLGGSFSSRKCDKSYNGSPSKNAGTLCNSETCALTSSNIPQHDVVFSLCKSSRYRQLIAPHAGGHTWKKTPCLGTAKATFDDAGGVAHLCPSTTFAHRKNAIRLDWIRLVQSQGTTDGSNGAPKIHPSIKDFPLKCRENLDRSRKLETKNGYRWKRGLINQIWRV